jgi:hypothetical protein
MKVFLLVPVSPTGMWRSRINHEEARLQRRFQTTEYVLERFVLHSWDGGVSRAERSNHFVRFADVAC